MINCLISCLIALATALVMTPVAIKVAPIVGAVDAPDARKVHQKIMPRLGGLAIYTAFMVGIIAYFWLDGGGFPEQVKGLLASTTIIFATGLVDDLKGISAKTKLLGQITAALVYVGFGGYVKYLSNPFMDGDIFYVDYWGIPITILWLVGISNAVNLIDGLDGLSSGVSIISACTMAVVSISQGYIMPAYLSLILAASALGFLKFNFSPAKIFMGDCGSLTLGYILAAVAIMGFSKGATIIALIIPILILGIPIFDTFFAIARRALEGKPIMQPDKGHLHHRLLAQGLSHKQTVAIIYAITLFMGCAAIILTITDGWVVAAILFICALATFVGAARLGIFSIVASRKANKK